MVNSLADDDDPANYDTWTRAELLEMRGYPQASNGSVATAVVEPDEGPEVASVACGECGNPYRPEQAQVGGRRIARSNAAAQAPPRPRAQATASGRARFRARETRSARQRNNVCQGRRRRPEPRNARRNGRPRNVCRFPGYPKRASRAIASRLGLRN